MINAVENHVYLHLCLAVVGQLGTIQQHRSVLIYQVKADTSIHMLSLTFLIVCLNPDMSSRIEVEMFKQTTFARLFQFELLRLVTGNKML